jgi:two-component system, OmpR family, sensor histidine kinase KdpD
VLIDLTPEDLIQRLREGRVYPADRVATALNGFFRVENLATLRELALRQVAEEVEAKRTVTFESLGTREDLVIRDAPQAVAERILVLVSARPPSQRLVRRAWRSAQRLQADLDVLHVEKPGASPSEEERNQLAALRRLASILGAHFVVEEGDDIAEVTRTVAAERGTTYVFIGAPRPARGLRRFGEQLPVKLLRKLPGVDIRIVADRSRQRDGAR